jgi:4-diphosphocytidyl-2-C-methyl-D-erythritol kinase
VSPQTLLVRSFCKINLALAVLSRREDGFHEIRTVLQTIDLHDTLELRPSRGLELRCQDLPLVAPQENLAWRAAQALSRAFSMKAGAEIVLRKTVPPGSGLGGGSSNAAATLLGLCRLWGLDVPRDALVPVACELGSDVPFFLEGGTAMGAGRGDWIHPLADLPESHLVVIYPGEPIPTAQAYQSLNLKLTSAGGAHKIHEFCGRLEDGADSLPEIFNDFETSVLPAYPAVKAAKDALIGQGATAALLSGSGSSVFGFFNDEESALAASRSLDRETWRVFPAKTLSRAEYFQRMFG